MVGMKISIKKKNILLTVIGLNISMFFGLIFVQPYTNANNLYDGFMSVITNRARSNKYNTLIVSYDGNLKDEHFMNEYYLYEMENKNINKNHSVLVSTSMLNDNELILDDFSVKSSIIFKRNIYADRVMDGNFKLRHDNLFYHGEPLMPPVNNIRKHISISESVANKLIEKSGLESFEDLKGINVEYKYYDELGQFTIEDFFVRGVIISNVGIMRQYQELYGNDIIFMLDNFLSFENVEAHFYFGASLTNNKYTFNIIDEMNMGEVAFRMAENNTVIDSTIVNEYKQYIRLANKSFLNTRPARIVFMFIVLLKLVISAFLMSQFREAYKVLFMIVFGVLILNELASYIFAINQYAVNWIMHNNIMRNGVLLVYLLILVSTTVFLVELRKKNEYNK